MAVRTPITAVSVWSREYNSGGPYVVSRRDTPAERLLAHCVCSFPLAYQAGGVDEFKLQLWSAFPVGVYALANPVSELTRVATR